MSYQALLFCPDEKTARTVTQVLSELEFTVAACTEPFAAVKKLMSDHFDALVVDCDNEQNATLLFKSARNSTSNQTSLAVAVVEGQAGVAKAFRFGANLVLTKPINVEQAKGTLRVARGLLRKGEPGKPAATPAGAASSQPASAASSSQAKPVTANPTPKPPAPPRAVPVSAKPGPSSLPPRPVPAGQPPLPKVSIPAQAAMSHSANDAANDDDLLELGTQASAAASAPSSAVNPAVAKDSQASQPSKLTTTVGETKPAVKAATSFVVSSGAASAPAPAIEPSRAAETIPATNEDDILEKPAETPASGPHASEGPTTTFTFGGAAIEQESSGGSKKILMVAAAVLVVAVGSYFGWNYYQSRTSQQASPVAAAHPAQPAPPVATPAATQPAPAQTTPASSTSTAPNLPTPAQPSGTATAATANTDESNADSVGEDAPEPAPTVKKAASASAKPGSRPAPAPVAVHGGKISSPAAKPAGNAGSDAPAPSVIGMAVPASSAPPLNLVAGNTNTAKPVLEKLNVSQGVSQGLLVKKVSPVYPRNALSMQVEGTVELLATISKNGDISGVKVLSGDPQLTKAAADAVKQWKYKPYLLNGEPVEIQTQVTINFRLPK